jgi:3-hydroxyacyl-CoA dehydrogenase/enoyl-CoA hydratase/3-hydroxybutyryl-CoA epimerase
MIFGGGFGPFHGGPLHYLHHSGTANLHNRLQQLANTYGEQFRANAGWQELGRGS